MMKDSLYYPAHVDQMETWSRRDEKRQLLVSWDPLRDAGSLQWTEMTAQLDLRKAIGQRGAGERQRKLEQPSGVFMNKEPATPGSGWRAKSVISMLCWDRWPGSESYCRIFLSESSCNQTIFSTAAFRPKSILLIGIKWGDRFERESRSDRKIDIKIDGHLKSTLY